MTGARNRSALSAYPDGARASNLKLGSVVSDVLGGSGHSVLMATIPGEDDRLLAALAQGHARIKTSELREALRGRIPSENASW